MLRQEFKQLGYVCLMIGWVVVLVKDYVDSDLNGDVLVYWFNLEVEGWGMDFWKLVEGVDFYM